MGFLLIKVSLWDALVNALEVSTDIDKPPAATLLLGRAQGKGVNMVIVATHHAIISLIAGILILIMPKLLNYIVAIYLIVTGLLALVR